MNSTDLMPFEIFQLTQTDLQSFRDLIGVFGAAFEEPETYLGAQPGDGYVENLLAQPTFIALAARCGDKVVGGLAAYELVKFEQQRSEIYIYDLAVSGPFRRQGVATGLIENLRRIASVRNAHVIFVQADHGDEPAIALYSKLGRCEVVLHFDIQPESERNGSGDSQS